MKIILKTNIPKLGVVGEICDVKKGYAKNYLIPHNLAIQATPKAIVKVEKQKKTIEDRKTQASEKYTAILKDLSGISLKLEVPTGEKQEMFAAIHASDIVQAIKKEKKIDMDPNFINLTSPIKELGEYNIEIDFGEGLATSLNLNILEKK